jgi:hypothetical protein
MTLPANRHMNSIRNRTGGSKETAERLPDTIVNPVSRTKSRELKVLRKRVMCARRAKIGGGCQEAVGEEKWQDESSPMRTRLSTPS